MVKYNGQTKVLVAIDCIIFGFDGNELKILLIQRSFSPEKFKWSLMGGFIQPNEDLDQAANHILKTLTGLEGVYLEQLYAFSNPNRDPFERIISVAYFALIDILKYETQISNNYHAQWFSLNQIPDLIFDHNQMVKLAKKQLRYKAALHPILFELLPGKFTIPQLQNLYEGIFETQIDKRNFSRKILSTKLLIKQPEKDKLNSKKGAFYYVLDMPKYIENFQAFLYFIPKQQASLQD
ncbi:MAG: NUDIX domain-containing protein [Sphingobacteriales bacterium]|nr:MAG: NUDIX domain-containing protein [Sphingobacteriales bacterium]